MTKNDLGEGKLQWARAALSLVTGSGAAQLVGFAGYLFIARIYSAAAFGGYAMWLAGVSVISVGVTAALETSLVNDESAERRRQTTTTILVIALLLSAIIFLFLTAFQTFAPNTAYKFGINSPASTCIGGCLLAGCTVMQTWGSTSGRFGLLAWLRVVQVLFIVGIPLILASIGYVSTDALVLGHAFGLFLAVSCWLYAFAPSPVDFVGLRSYRAFWFQRRRTVGFVLPAVIVSVGGASLPVLILGSRFGAESAGHISMAQRVLGLPLSVVGVPVRDIFRRQASISYLNKGHFAHEFGWSAVVLSVFSIFMIVVLLIGGGDLVAYVFGSQWLATGHIVLTLLPAYAIGLVASPLSTTVYIARREDVDLKWQVALLMVTLLTLLACDPLSRALWCYSIGYSIMYGVLLALCWRMAITSANVGKGEG